MRCPGSLSATARPVLVPLVRPSHVSYALLRAVVFSYPVVSGTKLAVRPGGSDTAASFLSVGGFAYLDQHNRLLHATTLLPTDKAEGGLQFAPPRHAAPPPHPGLSSSI